MGAFRNLYLPLQETALFSRKTISFHVKLDIFCRSCVSRETKEQMFAPSFVELLMFHVKPVESVNRLLFSQ